MTLIVCLIGGRAADPVTSRFDPALARELAGRAFVGPPSLHTA